MIVLAGSPTDFNQKDKHEILKFYFSLVRKFRTTIFPQSLSSKSFHTQLKQKLRNPRNDGEGKGEINLASFKGTEITVRKMQKSVQTKLQRTSYVSLHSQSLLLKKIKHFLEFCFTAEKGYRFNNLYHKADNSLKHSLNRRCT